MDPEKYSSFRKIVNVHKYVIKFINVLKERIGRNLPDKVGIPSSADHRLQAFRVLLRNEQKLKFPELVKFFSRSNVPNSKIPNLILQLNLYRYEHSLIRVKGKFNNYNPILISNNSRISELIVTDLHITFAHSGVYTILKELRKVFWVLRGFSFVRRILRNCISCKKVNELPIKTSQNCYRDFRSDPPQIPFRTVFLDYIGPVNVRFDGEIRKTWILIITCLYSRAVSLEICFSADTCEFLRCIQMHIYKFGMFSLCVSDLGSQISSGTDIMARFLDDRDCREYFSEHGIEKLCVRAKPLNVAKCTALHLAPQQN